MNRLRILICPFSGHKMGINCLKLGDIWHICGTNWRGIGRHGKVLVVTSQRIHHGCVPILFGATQQETRHENYYTRIAILFQVAILYYYFLFTILSSWCFTYSKCDVYKNIHIH